MLICYLIWCLCHSENNDRPLVQERSTVFSSTISWEPGNCLSNYTSTFTENYFNSDFAAIHQHLRNLTSPLVRVQRPPFPNAILPYAECALSRCALPSQSTLPLSSYLKSGGALWPRVALRMTINSTIKVNRVVWGIVGLIPAMISNSCPFWM